MFDKLPDHIEGVLGWGWADFAPYYADLEERALAADTIEAWLADWTRVNELLEEMETRLEVATTQDTTDQAAESAYKDFLDNLKPPYSSAEQRLKEKLLASGLEPEGFELPLCKMRAEAEIFREENIPLHTQVSKLGLEYDRISGAQSIDWDGEEKTLEQAYAMLDAPDRAQREALWRRIADRHLQDRDALNRLWQQMFELRQQIAANAGFENFRDYQWRNFKRFDYTPQDCEAFHAAIEAVVVPAATHVYQRQAQGLGVDQLRPWDTTRDNIYPPAPPQNSRL